MNRFAVVIARTSSSDRNGSCRFHAIAEPASIVSVSAAVTTTASARRGSSRRHRRTSPSAARIGIANPNVTNRSAGSHPVASANTTPATVSANHERRIRPALPPGIVNPTIASGTDTHCTYRVHRWTKRSRYAFRSSSVRPARRRNASFDVSTSSAGAPGRTASNPIPSTAPPPRAGPRQPERLAPVGPPGGRGGDEQDRDAHQEELRMREPPAGEHERGEHRSSTGPTVQQRSGREERCRRDQVRDVAGGQVHRERARQQPREHGAGCLRAPPHEGGRGEAHRHAQRDLERRGRLDDREPERPLEDERERRRSGPIRDRRQAVDTREPGPPEVDGRVRAHRELGAARDERPQEPQEQDDGEGRDQERVGPACASVRDATPVR